MTKTNPIHTLGLPVRVRTQTGGLWISIQTWLFPALEDEHLGSGDGAISEKRVKG